MQIRFASYSTKRLTASRLCCLTYLLLAISFGVAHSSAKAQDNWMDQMQANEDIAGPSGVVAGPFGRPIEVLDGTGQLQIALKVGSDSTVEYYIPDITSPGWVAWHAVEFRQQGTYTVMLYTYIKALQQTTRDMVTVDTRKDIASVRPGIWSNPIEVSLNHNPPKAARALARITEIVKREVELYKGLTAQQALAQSRMMTARMAAGAHTYNYPPPTSQPPSEIEKSIGSTSSSGVTAPEVIHSVMPAYTQAAVSARIEGNIVVGFTVDEQGIPQNVHIIKGLNSAVGLNQKSIEAAQQYRYTPAQANGKPIPFDTKVEFNFRLNQR